MTDANELIFTNAGSRYFHKTNEGFAVVSYASDTSSGLTFPILVSTNQNAVAYNVTGDFTSEVQSNYTMDYLGQTWYISNKDGWLPGDITSSENAALKITFASGKESYSANYTEEDILDIIKMAAQELLKKALNIN